MTTNAGGVLSSSSNVCYGQRPGSPVAEGCERSLSPVALDKMNKLLEFSGEMLTREKARDPSLDVVFTEINSKIFQKKKALSNEEVIALLSYCIALKTLNLSGFFRLTDTVLPPIASLKMLVSLNLSGTKIANLQPLIDSPLPNLKSVNFFDTEVSSDALVEFLNCHHIVELTPPLNPPKEFFVRIRNDFLESVKVFIGRHTKEILCYGEVIDFFKNAPKLLNLCVWIDDNTKFNSDDFNDLPRSRTISLKSRNINLVGCTLLGKSSYPT